MDRMKKDYENLLDYLYGLGFGIKPGLERISAAMEKLGNPQDDIKAIHITGTNGKGSVCAMISAILKKAGYRAGMFTSPHLVDLRERFQINGEKMSEEDAVRIAERVKETGVQLTFFEFTTAMAFVYFFEQGVDYAILEVGMGGRYDATNMIKSPVATAITSLSLDHQDYLGDLHGIAWEKAGIAKENVPMFTAADNETIRKECEAKKAPFFLVTSEERTSMKGDFQKKNAGVAAEIARHIDMKEEFIAAGLMNTYWPARLEFIESNVLLDCAHNPEGIEKMAEFVKTLNYEKLIIVFGVMKNKNYVEMIKLLPKYDRIILTKPEIDRSLDPKELRCDNNIVIENVGEAYEYAKSMAGENDLMLVCGSCYLAGEVLAYKNRIKMHPIMFV